MAAPLQPATVCVDDADINPPISDAAVLEIPRAGSLANSLRHCTHPPPPRSTPRSFLLVAAVSTFSSADIDMTAFSISANRLQNLMGRGRDVNGLIRYWQQLLGALTDDQFAELEFRQPGVCRRMYGMLDRLYMNVRLLEGELASAPLWQRVWPNTYTTRTIDAQFAELEKTMEFITTEVLFPPQANPVAAILAVNAAAPADMNANEDEETKDEGLHSHTMASVPASGTALAVTDSSDAAASVPAVAFDELGRRVLAAL